MTVDVSCILPGFVFTFQVSRIISRMNNCVESNEDGVFTREFDIGLHRPLILHQKEVGDVSCVVWDAALVLAKYLECETERNKFYLRERTIVELGAGLGCVALTAACFGGFVLATDLPDAVPLLQRNINANKELWMANNGKIDTQSLCWGKDLNEIFPPHLLLLADCVYYDESIQPLLHTMCALTDESTEVIISQELRDTEKQQIIWNKFLSLFNDSFDVKPIPPSQQHPFYQSSDICLMKAKKKCKTKH